MLQTKLHMKDKKKLRFSQDEKHDLFSLLEELERSQEKYQGCLWKILVRTETISRHLQHVMIIVAPDTFTRVAPLAEEMSGLS